MDARTTTSTITGTSSDAVGGRTRAPPGPLLPLLLVGRESCADRVDLILLRRPVEHAIVLTRAGMVRVREDHRVQVKVDKVRRIDSQAGKDGPQLVAIAWPTALYQCRSQDHPAAVAHANVIERKIEPVLGGSGLDFAMDRL